MASTTSLTTFDEFEQLPDEPGKSELLDGELIRLPPAKYNHMHIARRLFRLLDEKIRVAPNSFRAGEVCLEFGYKIGSRSWLQPDVSITHPDQPHGDYLEGAPLLAVEIISESNTAEQMDRKVKKYLSNGGTEVWLLYPKSNCVWIFREGHAQEFTALLRSEILPGLDIDIQQLLG